MDETPGDTLEAGRPVYALVQLVFCFHLSSFVIMKQIISILLNLFRCFKWNILNYVFSVTNNSDACSSCWIIQPPQIGTIRFIGLFSRNWFLTLEFKRGVAKFCRVFRGERLSSLEFLKVANPKFPRGFSEKHVLNHPLFGFFLEWLIIEKLPS